MKSGKSIEKTQPEMTILDGKLKAKNINVFLQFQIPFVYYDDFTWYKLQEEGQNLKSMANDFQLLPNACEAQSPGKEIDFLNISIYYHIIYD
jgi:hypothetical protein